jgi:hydrogenase nickel incorporation protein HypA/HybF
MHELTIVQALVDEAARHAREHRATSVRKLEVKIGELSGVEVALLETAYATFRDRTLCSAADLCVERVPARWQCARCSHVRELGEPLSCTACGAPLRLVAGDEIVLERIEMEVA